MRLAALFLLIPAAGPETEVRALEPATNAVSPDLAGQAARLKERAPPGFTVVVQPPFIVLGDESPPLVARRATETVKWAVDALKRDYFEKDPDETIAIWLFRDMHSYTNHAWLIFRDRPDTPFGYYSASDRALVMNIATGGGTLIHEIVHPFIRANFPDCPAWFNEGLASLYEQSTERAGRIWGLTNWRLPALQESIRKRQVLTFEKLTALSDDEFYGRTTGAPYNNHYAQARYLCYYLQEKGLLTKFYKEFSTASKEDPGGYKSLRKVLGNPDMDAFQKRWETFVLGLRFR